MKENSSTEFGKTNTKNHEVNTARDFIYLTGCMLQEKTPDKQRLQKMNFGRFTGFQKSICFHPLYI